MINYHIKTEYGSLLTSFLTKLMAFGVADLAVRVVRLMTVIVTARILAPETVGVAALALVLFELTRVLMQIGIGQQIIASRPAQLAALCNTAHRIFWHWSWVVMAIQLMLALVMATIFANPMVGAMLALLSLVYIMMPGGLVSCYLLMREGRAPATARIGATQTIADHLLSAALLLVWPSPWAIILPKLLTAPIWLVLTRRARPWRPQPAAGYLPWAPLLPQSYAILATEMLAALRAQADKLIVAALLGVSALGTYYFAFNAGVGIISTFTGAFGIILFPTICAERAGNGARGRLFIRLALAGSILMLGLVAFLSGLAHWYVPLVFGANWAHAGSLVAVLALAGIPLFAFALISAWLRSTARAALDARLAVGSCVAALGLLTFGAAISGLEGAAAGWVAGMMMVALPALAGIVVAIRRTSHMAAGLEGRS